MLYVLLIYYNLESYLASLVTQSVKKSTCNVGDLGSIPGSILGWEDLLEEGTTTHSSILVGESPKVEEPGRLQSMELQRVRHD